MIAVVLCTGESLTLDDIEHCRGRSKVIAVSDAVYLAPWADAMVSHDAAWWRAHAGLRYDGPKWCCHPGGVPEFGVECDPDGYGNSGILGLVVAMKMGATKVLLLGADGHGTHFFGKHTGNKLKNADANKHAIHRNQWAKYSHLPVVNCTPGSLIDCFPRGDLRTELDGDRMDGVEAGSRAA